jgi:hypothetical protein
MKTFRALSDPTGNMRWFAVYCPHCRLAINHLLVACPRCRQAPTLQAFGRSPRAAEARARAVMLGKRGPRLGD